MSPSPPRSRHAAPTRPRPPPRRHRGRGSFHAFRENEDLSTRASRTKCSLWSSGSPGAAWSMPVRSAARRTGSVARRASLPTSVAMTARTAGSTSSSRRKIARKPCSNSSSFRGSGTWASSPRDPKYERRHRPHKARLRPEMPVHGANRDAGLLGHRGDGQLGHATGHRLHDGLDDAPLDGSVLRVVRGAPIRSRASLRLRGTTHAANLQCVLTLSGL